ncbi:MAG TPA: dihydrodipicolinate reductase C-terminal domain-containing protein [Gaiellaceae bacterium]|nr:dihydrodipicolinate reductase C-terminal domain-containing protein [Gaiellaceae bacterium]
MKLALVGAYGKVGSVLRPALEAVGHDVTPIGRDDRLEVVDHDAAINFTRPDAVYVTVRRCLEQGVPGVVGTTGLGPKELDALGSLALEQNVPLFVAPNFAVGAVLMIRLAAEAARTLPRGEIVELHHESKVDAPSGTAKATAERMGGEVPIHSVRLPGLVAHQEVLFGEPGGLLTIRHDAFSREAYVPGVLLALEKLASLPPGLTVGLETLLA